MHISVLAQSLVFGDLVLASETLAQVCVVEHFGHGSVVDELYCNVAMLSTVHVMRKLSVTLKMIW